MAKEPAIYLDHNSTTPMAPEVAEAIYEAQRAGYANPASQHQQGQKSRRLLEETRDAILSLLGGKTSGMDADRLIFTSGGTEANNLALRGLMGDSPARLLVSSIEHPSVQAVAEHLQLQGHRIERLRATASGEIDVTHAVELISRPPRPALVAAMLANNETGVVQPIADLGELCQHYQSLLVCDAVQGVGKLHVSFRALGAAAMTIAPHKFGGPLGIGALVVRHDVKLAPLLYGGFQQEGLRPGTENVALAVGFRRALELAVRELAERSRHLELLRDAFETALTSLGPVVNGSGPRLPNTSNLAFPGVDRQQLLLALDAAGVGCSTGSACASGSSEPSPTLLAMGLDPAVVASSLRFSFGMTNTASEALLAAERIVRCINNLRSRPLARNLPLVPRHRG